MMLKAVSVISGAFYLLLLLLKAGLAASYVRRQKRRDTTLPSGAAERLVIVQPILGGDPQLEEMLSTNVDTLPAEVRFLWMVDQQDPVGAEVAIQLAATRPNVTVITCPPSADNENPKAFKLELARKQLANAGAETEYYVVLDDDTLIDEASLAAAYDSLQTADLYTGLPAYCPADNLWGSLVTQFVNNNSVLTYLPLLNFMPPLTINGMFYAVRMRSLVSAGGFQPIIHELCDDFAMRQLAARHDWRVEQGVTFQRLSTSVENGRRYWQIMHRWFVFAWQLVRAQTLGVQLLLGLMLGVPPILLTLFMGSTLAWLCYDSFAIGEIAFFLPAREVVIWTVQRIAGVPVAPLQPFVSLAAELAQPFQSLAGALFPTIQWRSRRIRVGPGQAFRILGERDS